MEKDIFKERGRGEEEAYFRQQDAKLIERLRQASLVSRELIDKRAHLAQVVAQHRLARMHDRLLILR